MHGRCLTAIWLGQQALELHWHASGLRILCCYLKAQMLRLCQASDIMWAHLLALQRPPLEVASLVLVHPRPRFLFMCGPCSQLVVS